MGSVYRHAWRDRKTGEYREVKTWWLKYYRDGKAIRESSGTESEQKARRLLKLREGDVARGAQITPKMGRIKFSELARDEINDYRANHRRSLEDLEARLEKHILPRFGEARASAITTADIRKYVIQRQEEGAASGTINRELTAIKRAFSLAAQAGKILAKPHIPMLRENNVRKGFFEREQFESVRGHLPDADVRALVTFAYLTGWRMRSEVCPLKWPQVDLQAGLVRLEPGTTKNDEARVFPFTRELRELLEAQSAKSDALKRQGIICPLVFSRKGKPIKEFRRTWKSACEAAGVPGRIPHDFRRTAVRNLVRASVPERVAMQMTGHKTRSVFERYNIVSEGDLFDAARRIDSVMGTFPGTCRASSANQAEASSVQVSHNQELTYCAPVAQLDRAAVS